LAFSDSSFRLLAAPGRPPPHNYMFRIAHQTLKPPSKQTTKIFVDITNSFVVWCCS
jgi:hypothetical protein